MVKEKKVEGQAGFVASFSSSKHLKDVIYLLRQDENVKAMEDEEKEMEVVELIVHNEGDLEMKLEQVERAKKR